MTAIGAERKPGCQVACFRFAPIPVIRRGSIEGVKSTHCWLILVPVMIATSQCPEALTAETTSKWSDEYQQRL
jgi:hypothetical protein